MKKSITKKIESLLSSMYGYKLSQTNDPVNHRTEENKEHRQLRCKSLPFEFIRLLF